MEFNWKLLSGGTIVENYFGHATRLWTVSSQNSRWNESNYDNFFLFCPAMTNFHIYGHCEERTMLISLVYTIDSGQFLRVRLRNVKLLSRETLLAVVNLWWVLTIVAYRKIATLVNTECFITNKQLDAFLRNFCCAGFTWWRVII